MFSTRVISRLSVFGLACMLLAQAASGAAPGGLNIKQVQVVEDARVDLLLDGKISDSQIRTEFINDIIQLSLSDTSVYPAKISSLSGESLTKVFVYQYAPKLVRVRLTVKGKAEAYQGKVQVKPNGKVLSIALSGAGSTDQVQTKAAQMRKKPETPAAQTSDAEERLLLNKILNADRTVEKAPEKAVEKKAEEKKAPASVRAPKPVDSLINPGRAVASFAGILLLMGAVFIGLRRLAAQARSGEGKSGALGKLLTRTLGKPEKMIEVVATHYLGPKKSIHVVRVAGRTMVLGVSDGSINLISEFAGEAPASHEASGGDFMAELGEQLARESGGRAMGVGAVSAGPALPVSTPVAAPSPRDRIRSRLEGMKQL